MNNVKQADYDLVNGVYSIRVREWGGGHRDREKRTEALPVGVSATNVKDHKVLGSCREIAQDTMLVPVIRLGKQGRIEIYRSVEPFAEFSTKVINSPLFSCPMPPTRLEPPCPLADRVDELTPGKHGIEYFEHVGNWQIRGCIMDFNFPHVGGIVNGGKA
jgi:hypothetical protein